VPRTFVIAKRNAPPSIVVGERYFVVKVLDSYVFFARKPRRQLVVHTDVAFHRKTGRASVETFTSLHRQIIANPKGGCRPLTDATVVDSVPAVMDRIAVSTRFTLVRSSDIAGWEKVIRTGALVATATFVPHLLPVAKAASDLADRVAGSIFRGPTVTPFQPTCDKNLGAGELTDAYYVYMHTGKAAIRADGLSIEDGTLHWKGSPIVDDSYVVFEVKSFLERGRVLGEGQPWYNLLYWAEEDAKGAASGSASTRAAARARYQATIDAVKRVFQDDESFLQQERDLIIQESALKTLPLFDGPDGPSGARRRRGPEPAPSSGSAILPRLTSEMKRVLEVKSEGELRRNVEGYQAALAESAKILAAE